MRRKQTIKGRKTKLGRGNNFKQSSFEYKLAPFSDEFLLQID